jgi:tRNA(adenine34) deaminase
VGAVVVKDGAIVGEGINTRETLLDPAGHAEINALRAAAQHTGSWRLSGCTLYVTLEPCCMCAAAIVQSRISRVVFGAYDPQAGGCGSLYRLTEDPAFNHFTPADGGLMAQEAQALMNAVLRK